MLSMCLSRVNEILKEELEKVSIGIESILEPTKLTQYDIYRQCKFYKDRVFRQILISYKLNKITDELIEYKYLLSLLKCKNNNIDRYQLFKNLLEVDILESYFDEFVGYTQVQLDILEDEGYKLDISIDEKLYQFVLNTYNIILKYIDCGKIEELKKL